MLGPPAQYLIMIDIDSDTIARLFETDKKAWKKLTKELIGYIDFIIGHYNKIDKWHIESAALFVRSRRGGHLIYRMEKEDWEKLHAITKANRKLGKITIMLDGKVYEAEIELRTLGVTPLYSFKHQLRYAPRKGLKPLSFSKLKKALENLGLKLETSRQLSQYNNDNSTRETHPQQNNKNGWPAQEEKQQKEEQEQRSVENNNQTRQTSRRTQPEQTQQQTRRLTEQQITTIVNTIYPYWVPGHRNALELALVGWLIKANVTEELATEIIKRISEAAGDEERDKRLEEVHRQYRMIETGERDKNELIGKTGLLEELQQIIAEQNPGITAEEARDRALQTIHALEQILGPRRSRVIMTPYETGTFFVNDPWRGILLVKIKETEDGEIRRYRKYISDWYVKQVLIVKAGGQYLYKILFRNARTGEKHVISGQLDEITKQLKRMHGVKRTQLLFDAISAIVSEFKRRKLAKYKHTAEVAGILPTREGVKFIRAGALSTTLLPKEPDPEKARQALELLIQLRKHYDNNKFDIAINWTAYAPISYALKKHYHVKQIYLLLHGEKQTGKTTLARIITALYPTVVAEEEEIAEEAQSEYRLAWKLNITTLPLLEDEVQGITRKPGLLGLLKRAATGDIVRWRGDQARRYHARTALILTSNYRELLNDAALNERIIQIEFTHDDYVYNKQKTEREEFKKLYNEYRTVANNLGAILLQTTVEKWQEITEHWPHKLQEKQDYIELGKQIWHWTAEKLGLEPPEWTKTETKIEEEKVDEIIIEAFWDTLHDIILEHARLHKCEETILGCLAALGREGKLPSTLVEWTPTKIIVKAPIVKLIENKLDIQVIGGLRNLAEKLGLKYGKVKVRGKVTKGMIIPVEKLIGTIGTEKEYTDYIAQVLLPYAIMEDWGRSGGPIIPNVLERAQKLGFNINNKTAEEIDEKLIRLMYKIREKQYS